MEYSEMHGLFPVDRQFQNVTMDGWKLEGKVLHRDAWMTAANWTKSFPRWLATKKNASDWSRTGRGIILHGPPGTGKTMLSCAMLNFLHDHGHSTAYLRDQDLAELLRARRFTRMDDAQVEVLDMLEMTHVVVIDDFMRLGGDDVLMEALLRSRHGNGRPTILTVNNEVKFNDVMRSFLSNWEWAYFTEADDFRIVAS